MKQDIFQQLREIVNQHNYTSDATDSAIKTALHIIEDSASWERNKRDAKERKSLVQAV